MRPTERVDVVLPVRNGESYIWAALDSLTADAQCIDRVIVVDDGSTDATADLVAHYGGPLDVCLIQQAALGIVEALNRGLGAVRTTFFARMDADDLSLAGRMPAQLDVLRADPAIAAVGAQIQLIDALGVPLNKRSNYPTEPQQIKHQLLWGCPICHPTVMARTEAVLAAGGYRPLFEGAEDYDLWLRLSEEYEVANLPGIFLRYRIHPAQATRPHNLRQALSRDLALFCARSRRNGQSDPAFDLRIHEKTVTCADPRSRLGRLVAAHATLKAFREGIAVPDSALFELLAFCRDRYLSTSRRRRYGLMRQIAEAFLRRWNVAAFASAFIAMCRCRLTESKWGRARASELA
jgi:glycosyltransferase involved in cell wall biosynthesis